MPGFLPRVWTGSNTDKIIRIWPTVPYFKKSPVLIPSNMMLSSHKSVYLLARKLILLTAILPSLHWTICSDVDVIAAGISDGLNEYFFHCDVSSTGIS